VTRHADIGNSIRSGILKVSTKEERNGQADFHLHHAHSGDNIWSGYEYVNRNGDTAVRVTENVIHSRIARASHGKPVAEPLERTALRLLKRAGRPELSERYARIRKHIAATRGNA
jgi:hypothetical protein